MNKSFLNKNILPKQLHEDVVSLSYRHIHTYINTQTQSGYRAITRYYTVNQNDMRGNCINIHFKLLKLIIRDKQNNIVIVNPKNNKEI